MKKTVLGMLVCLLFALTSFCLADPSASTTVRLRVRPYCMVDILEPVDVTVLQPGQIPENKTYVEISCNYNYNVKVEWELPHDWPGGVTIHDNIAGNFSPGIQKGKLWLGGITTFEDLAATYKGKVIVTISIAP